MAVAKAKRKEVTMAVKLIDPEKIEDNPYQPRSHYPTKTIAEIAYSIEQIGIIHIPTGRQVDGHYELAEGHLRKRAYIKLKKKDPKKFGEMPFDVREITDRDMAIIALEENLRRQDITPLEQARAVDMYLINFTDVTETALAKTLNMTQGNISNMRRVLKCPDEVLQKIVDGKINFTMARELLIFQGLNVGFDEEYRGGKSVKVPKDEKWLMLSAVRGVGGQYGRTATVDGIKRCIYDVADRNPFATWDEVCKGCINKKSCERKGIVSVEDGGGYACKDRVTKENYQEVREKAKVDMPDSFKNLVKDRAGTRAIVLDLRELRLGSYRDELKAGHAMLDGTFYEQGEGLYGGRQRQLLQAIEDPEECLERCTEGFHYAYDSDKMDGEVHFVCSKPKCLTKKKAAFTRAKNAAGTGKKKAELKAIKQAVEETETIDKPRLLLIMEAQLQGSHVARGYGGDHFDWLAKRLKIEKEGMGESKQTLILKKLPGLSEDELRKLVVEFCLITLCYEGNVKGYRIQTTEKLNRMSIGIQVEKA